MNSFTKKSMVALGIAALAFAANAQFTAGAGSEDLAQQVKSALTTGQSLDAIVQAAIAAGVSPAALAAELVRNGQSATEVTTAVLTVSPKDANSVVATLTLAADGAEKAAIIAAAKKVKGVDVASLDTATGAGGGAGTGGGGGGGSSFGTAAGSSFGGGGGGSASRS
ncbi:hypothetical protein [Curvibacter gracilis]|uniref:hypothetical protein n=1 Tax=Curvibacter gracilis TaxID=230310 RepID=UPI0004870D66|nr:hypothetical protein [Curvibacter gracilis]